MSKKKQTVLGIIGKGLENEKENITLLYKSTRYLHLEYCVQFWHLIANRV